MSKTSKFEAEIRATEGTAVSVNVNGATFSGVIHFSGDLVTLTQIVTYNGQWVAADKAGEKILYLEIGSVRARISAVTVVSPLEASDYWSTLGSRDRHLISRT